MLRGWGAAGVSRFSSFTQLRRFLPVPSTKTIEVEHMKTVTGRWRPPQEVGESYRWYSTSAPDRLIKIKYSESVQEFSVSSSCKISQLLQNAGNHFKVETNSIGFRIIHGAHPSLTQSGLDTFTTEDCSPLEFLKHHNSTEQEIHQPFLELYQEPDVIEDARVHKSDKELFAIIAKHLADYCLEPETLERIMKHILPDLTDEDLQSPLFRRKMKLIYPTLLRFQNVGHSLLSFDNEQLLGQNAALSTFETSQILTPIFVSFFTKSDPNTLEQLTRIEDKKRKNLERDFLYLAERLANLCQPHEWYPLAREMKRKIILHVGPTNSGKTHSSLEALRSAPSGVYCGPLRLLAQEVYEKFKSEEIPISLLTGQQRFVEEGNTHVSCTVEMANVTTMIHCAVVDEIQMIADPDRGWAWSRAVMGIPANEIHLCGNETSINLIKEITKSCGDILEIKNYERLSPLKVPQEPVETIYDLTPGDCIITFSRAKIFAIKQQIERELKKKCCVVYGRLPPETRSQQAKLFNSGSKDYPFLIATDAIGMGLNLNIRRVVFSTLVKFNGKQEAQLAPAEVKQIAGRAGRFKSIFPVGQATSFDDDEQNYIRYSVNTPLKQAPYAGILPNYEQIEMFALGTQQGEIERRKFSEILEDFTDLATVDNQYFLCGFDSMLDIAKAIDFVPLSLKDRYTICLAPCTVKNPYILNYLMQYARKYSVISLQMNIEANPDDILPTEKRMDLSIECNVPVLISEKMLKDASLETVENIYSVLDLYVWLSWRFPEFSEREKATNIQKQCNTQIEEALASSNKETSILRNKKKKRTKRGYTKRR